MGHKIIEVAVLVGFMAVWLGFVCLFLPMGFRYVFRGLWLKSLTMRYDERAKLGSIFMSEEFQKIGKSRNGRAGHLLLALGSSILILAGIGWLTLAIIEKQGLSG